MILRVLRAPMVRPLVASALAARLNTTIVPLALVLLVRQHAGSFASAGLVTSAYTLGFGTTGPLLGRLAALTALAGLPLAAQMARRSEVLMAMAPPGARVEASAWLGFATTVGSSLGGPSRAWWSKPTGGGPGWGSPWLRRPGPP